LGQGLGNAVGMALAEKLMADEFNRPGHAIVDHRTYVFLGDGCMMEGISHEACALAAAWKLNKLIALYDDNGISIDGAVRGWFIDDTPARFRAYGWHVIGPLDGHDVDAIDVALAQARQCLDKPTLIVCRTTIGRGSPGRAGSAKAHGEPLGADEIRRTREAIDWPHAPFEIPAAIAARWDARHAGAAHEASWRTRVAAYRAAFPALADEFERRVSGVLPDDFDATRARVLGEFGHCDETLATRKASQKVLALLAPKLPELIGGSADLTGSNLTDFPGCGAVRGGEKGGRHIHYGVREFGMAAVMNGLALHGGFIPYGGTFLTFSDYSRNAIRMAALMKRRVIHVFTHDSIGLGEDGPTHQSVEHAASLRLIPNLEVWRPCDAAETAVAWLQAVAATDRPSALLLSRQTLPAMSRTDQQVTDIARGGYVLCDREHAVAAILATGSEVSLAIATQTLLDGRRIAVRVVSLPSTTVFDRQDAAYREAVLGHALPRIGVEAGVTRWWGQYGCSAALGVDRYGESAPAAALFEHFGLTATWCSSIACPRHTRSARARHEHNLPPFDRAARDKWCGRCIEVGRATSGLRGGQLRSGRHAGRHRRRDRRSSQQRTAGARPTTAIAAGNHRPHWRRLAPADVEAAGTPPPRATEPGRHRAARSRVRDLRTEARSHHRQCGQALCRCA
jgi:transketolase